jgi:hypothetical protein
MLLSTSWTHVGHQLVICSDGDVFFLALFLIKKKNVKLLLVLLSWNGWLNR